MRREDRFARDSRRDAVVVALGTLVAIVLCIVPYHVVANLPSLCLFHWLGFERCPGCGTIRAASLLAHGQFLEAVRMNWRIVLIAPLCVWLFGSAVVRMCLHHISGRVQTSYRDVIFPQP